MSFSLIEYVKSFTDTFEQSPLTDVDSLVFSNLSYCHYDTFIPAEKRLFAHVPTFCELFAEQNIRTLISGVHGEEDEYKFLSALRESPRFKNVRMVCFSNIFEASEEKQFCAITYILNRRLFYVAYRGTDSTIVGWKEDFNLSFMDEVPAQREAVEYLNARARRLHGKIYVGGHSKGGNLAVYAAIKCNPSVKNRIISVFSHDGPGFKKGLFDNSDFASIENKLKKTVPQSSLIGMLLDDFDAHTIIKSNASGILQHNPFTWEIENNAFIVLTEITKGARRVNETISDWLAGLSEEKRALFVEALFDIIEATGAKTIHDFEDIGFSDLKAALGAIKHIDTETRKGVLEALKILASAAIKNTAHLS